jgi:hypothetical protein
LKRDHDGEITTDADPYFSLPAQTWIITQHLEESALLMSQNEVATLRPDSRDLTMNSHKRRLLSHVVLPVAKELCHPYFSLPAQTWIITQHLEESALLMSQNEVARHGPVST